MSQSGFEIVHENVRIKIESDRNIAQFGSVLEWGSRGLGFKSRYSDHLKERKNGRKTVFIMFIVFLSFTSSLHT